MRVALALGGGEVQAMSQSGEYESNEELTARLEVLSQFTGDYFWRHFFAGGYAQTTLLRDFESVGMGGVFGLGYVSQMDRDNGHSHGIDVSLGYNRELDDRYAHLGPHRIEYGAHAFLGWFNVAAGLHATQSKSATRGVPVPAQPINRFMATVQVNFDL